MESNTSSPNLPKLVSPSKNNMRNKSHDPIAKLNRSFMSNSQSSPKFVVPNISAFKKTELGEKGSLFNMQNES